MLWQILEYAMGVSGMKTSGVEFCKQLRKHRLAVLGLRLLAAIILFAVISPWIARYAPADIDLYNISSAPSKAHWLGTDDLGRDVFARLAEGASVSLTVGFAATLIQLLLGVLLGLIAGYFGGWIDKIIMRLVDIMMCFPFFVIAIAIAAVVGPSLWNIVFIIGFLSWTKLARIVRGEVLVIREKEFIQSARMMGLNHFEMMWRHILPNVLSPVIVYSTIAIANAILSEASLSFLGMGVRPPQASWGNMLSAAQNMRTLAYEWWLWLPPGLMIFITVLGIHFLGDGLRDTLDPKERRG